MQHRVTRIITESYKSGSGQNGRTLADFHILIIERKAKITEIQLTLNYLKGRGGIFKG